MHVQQYVNQRLYSVKRVTARNSICITFASHWVMDVEFESVTAVWASVFVLKTTHAQLVV